MARLMVLVLSAFIALPAGAADKHNCLCVYDGGEVEEGKTVCLETADGFKLARCEMSLNNTSWKILDESCDRLQSQVNINLQVNG